MTMKKKPSGVKSVIRSWLGIPAGESDYWVYSSTSNSGQRVDEKTMLTLSTVWACTRLISETIATLPLKLYEKTPDGRVVATNHPVYRIIHDSPNVKSTASLTWQACVAAMMLRGAARFEKLMIGNRVVGIFFLSPNRLSITLDSQGNTKYKYTQSDGTQRDIPASRIMTIPGFTLDGINGVSVIEYSANVIGAALAADDASSKTFKKGLLPTVAFKLQNFLKPQQREDFRDNFNKIAGAVNAGEPALLEGGMDAISIGIKPSDAQLLESRGFSVEELCRWFRVPPWMVGHSSQGQTKWGTGMEQEMIAFVTFTLMPWLKRITEIIQKELLSPEEQVRFYAEFDVNGLLRADSSGRASFYTSMVNNGIMTRDECREKENLPLMGGNAEVLTVNAGFVPLDDITKAQTTIRSLMQLGDKLNEK